MPRAATTPDPLEDLQGQLAQLRVARREERRKIITIAQRYAREHNLCGVVDRALAEAGLLGGDKVITVNVELPMQVTISVDGEEFDGMTNEEKEEHLKNLGKVTNVTWEPGTLGAVAGLANGNLRRSMPATRIGDLVIKSYEEGASASTAGGVVGWPTCPPGYVARYSAPSGRKVHFVETGRDTRYPDRNPMGLSSRPLCGADLSHYYQTDWWMETSARAQNVGIHQGVCLECKRIARDRFGINFLAHNR